MQKTAQDKGARRAVVGIPCDLRMIGQHPFHAVGEKYIAAAERGADALPFLIPVLPKPLAPAEILSHVDGLLFTGSPSNVAPRHYGGTPPREGVLQDEARDATTLPLLREALARGVPVLCLCRGFQELNVVMGGTLHQHVEEVPGRFDHRAPEGRPLEERYGPAHEVAIAPDGMLASIAREAGLSSLAVKVNSLHGQGIDRLAPGLQVEAKAPDSTIEAVSLKQPKGFALALQWHPEWRFWENPLSQAIFAAFGRALAEEARRKAAVS